MATRKKTASKTGAKKATDPTRDRATKLALSLIDFQKATFDTSINMLASVQDQSGKVVHHVLLNSPWLPREGRKIVEEWAKTVRRGREDFKKSMDKSFDFLANYLKRLQAEERGEEKAPGRKRAKK